MKLRKSLLAISLMAFIPAFAYASDITDVASAVHAKFPATQSVNASEFSQSGPLYTFMFAGQRVYTDKNATYMLVGGELLAKDPSGKMVNYSPKTVQQQASQAAVSQPSSTDQFGPISFTSVIGKAPVKRTLDESTLSPQHIQDVWKALPWERTLTYVYGKGERHVFVLEDPDCPFCAQFEKNLDAIGPSLNATVSILPLVLPMHEKDVSAGFANGTRHLKGLMCSNNFAGNWRDWMNFSADNIFEADGKTPVSPDVNWVKWTATRGVAADANCALTATIDKNLNVAKNLGLSGTPTLIFSNGMVLNGVPADRAALLDLLNKGWTYAESHPIVAPIKK